MRKSNTLKEQETEEDKKDLHHINDKSFKTVMKIKASALEYLKVLYPSLYAQIDENDFELDDTNHVDSEVICWEWMKKDYSEAFFCLIPTQKGRGKFMN